MPGTGREEGREYPMSLRQQQTHPSSRLRIRLASGAEIEAEGSPEFVAAERQEFISLQSSGAGQAAHLSLSAGSHDALVSWDAILEAKGNILQLRTKLRGEKTEKDACLLLLAAAQTLLRNHKPTSTQIARWLRASGYPIARVDRAIQEGLEKGEILASGSRRARRYALSGPGKVKALLLAVQLTEFVTGQRWKRPTK